MDKAIFGGSLASVVFLLTGTYVFPHSPIMWLAGTSLTYTIFRLIMTGMLLVVLLSNPPRKMFVRIAMGIIAVVLTGWGVDLMWQGSYKLLDMILFVELGIAFGLAALEVTETGVTDAVATRAPQGHPRTKTA